MCEKQKLYAAFSFAGTQCNVCLLAEVGRLGRSSSAAGVRQVGGGDVQRQSSLPAREALNQVNTRRAALEPGTMPSSFKKLGEILTLFSLLLPLSVRDSGPLGLFIAARYAQ